MIEKLKMPVSIVLYLIKPKVIYALTKKNEDDNIPENESSKMEFKLF